MCFASACHGLKPPILGDNSLLQAKYHSRERGMRSADMEMLSSVGDIKPARSIDIWHDIQLQRGHVENRPCGP